MKKSTFYIAIAVCTAILIVYLLLDRRRIYELFAQERLKRLEAENRHLQVLEAYLKKVQSHTEMIKTELEYLKATYSGINAQIETELNTTIELLENGHPGIAIEKVTKVVENMLAVKLEEKQGLQLDKKMTFYECIKTAVKHNIIGNRIGDFIDLIRKPRNEEAHQLAVEFKPEETVIYLLSGIHVLYELGGIKRNSPLSEAQAA